MEVKFNTYYSTVCHVCKSIPNDSHVTRFCSGCKLIQYCNHAHQKEHWPSHRELCKAVQNILKKSGTDHLFQEACGYNIEDLKFEWSNLRVSVIKLVELFLSRSLTPEEIQILFFPPLCQFCFSYKANKMFSCSSCNTVIYCSLDHKQRDDTHKNNCAHLRLSFKLDLLRFFRHEMAISSFSVLFKKLKMFPSDMESLSKHFQGNAYNDFVLSSEQLSFCLTLLFAINKVGKTTLSKLTVHIVGADEMELSAIETFSLIPLLIPHLLHLKIILIGPNIPTSVSIPVNIAKNCELYRVDMLYHEYVNSDCYVHPDVVAMFNCGFCEHLNFPEKDIWKMSLPCIANIKHALVVLTSYTIDEARVDVKRLFESSSNELSIERIVESQINPFSSMYPHRDWENFGYVFYINKYISVLRI